MTPMFYFLVALTTVLAVAAQDQVKFVLDSNRFPVEYNQSYYAVPRLGGSLNLSSRGDKQCPLYVQRQISLLGKGIPIKFSTTIDAYHVPQHESLYIEMDTVPTNSSCSQESYWWADRFVAVGPKQQDLSKNSFQIVEQFLPGVWDHYYHIYYCPTSDSCKNVGVTLDEFGTPRLTVGTFEIFSVKFVRND
ncbi:unnamed protein product [Eruca vesicaria subsp. sativa]|uniref:Uncharacterized protein n=1 Tax=Eruca vesicaria subsp. sativa TaxID=29727 RepID=A0ABC8JMY3_ERUVS|nr:unnamed protein product [Eruca vesicaria subsp. sativa]